MTKLFWYIYRNDNTLELANAPSAITLLIEIVWRRYTLPRWHSIIIFLIIFKKVKKINKSMIY